MRNRIITGLVIAGSAAWVWAVKEGLDYRRVSRELAVLQAQKNELDVKGVGAARFKTAAALKLDDVYHRWVGDMTRAGRVYGTGVSIDGGSPLFRHSSFSGLREAHVQVKFTGIPRRAVLASLLGVLDESAAQCPFLAEKILQEKDALTVNVWLMGK
jgi:hypothetical protein